MTGKYDFDAVIDRRGTSCLKYDFGMKRVGRDDLLPLWVADMDFRLPEDILADLRRRVDHGIFGYTEPDAEYYAALDRWFSTRHGYHVDPETVTLGCSVVYGLAVSVRAFSEPGDAVLIQQPVYYPFREVIEDNGRKFINNQLRYEDGKYSIDFDDFEKKIAENRVKLFILCNPHNPVGRVWTREELERLGDICLRHNVIILDDEIHCDFNFPGHKTTSFMTLDSRYQKNLVLFTSPSKTFNVAGLQSANIIVPDPELRARYRRANSAAGYSQGSVMGIEAVKSVYTRGDEWFNDLTEYLTGNMEYVRDFVRTRIPGAHFVEPEGTYLLWIDFSGCGFTDEELEHIMVDEARLWLDPGVIFGPATAQFERFNIACPRATVRQAFHQLREALDHHRKE
ncbi:MAG: pyridoxal phosphate-dependent aminotransferase [Fretibacterium sp.]|nr:pyridoxal phosphate-dependent aminotransferase [Fretibacterium sp.]